MDVCVLRYFLFGLNIVPIDHHYGFIYVRSAWPLRTSVFITWTHQSCRKRSASRPSLSIQSCNFSRPMTLNDHYALCFKYMRLSELTTKIMIYCGIAQSSSLRQRGFSCLTVVLTWLHSAYTVNLLHSVWSLFYFQKVNFSFRRWKLIQYRIWIFKICKKKS